MWRSPRFDDRRVEVIANGLLLWNGAQLAVETTVVSLLTASGGARSLRDPARPIALQENRHRKESTYPELAGNACCRLVVLGWFAFGTCLHPFPESLTVQQVLSTFYFEYPQ